MVPMDKLPLPNSVWEPPLFTSMMMLLRLLPETLRRPTRVRPPFAEAPDTKKAKLPLGAGGGVPPDCATASPVSIGPVVAELMLMNLTRLEIHDIKRIGLAFNRGCAAPRGRVRGVRDEVSGDARAARQTTVVVRVFEPGRDYSTACRKTPNQGLRVGTARRLGSVQPGKIEHVRSGNSGGKRSRIL